MAILASWSAASIVAEICERAGIPFDRYEVGLVEGTVDGFSTTCEHSAGSAIESLSSNYMFDAANYGGEIHFIPRGGPVKMEIDENFLVETGEPLKEISRRDPITIPRVVHLEYYDTDGGLTTDKQTSDRSLDSRSKAESTSETTIIMDADQAAKVAVISHKVGIEEQKGEVTFTLDSSYLALTVADIIILRDDRLRITEVAIDEDRQKYKATFDRASAYQSDIQGFPIVPPSTPPSLIIGDSRIEFIDSHILRDGDDKLGYYIAVSSLTQNWNGATVEISKDGGANWINSDTTTNNAIIGETSYILGPHNIDYIDRKNIVEVTLLRDDMELLPATFTEMLNRANLAIIGDELINFSEVNQVGPKEWELSGFLRGRKGSSMSSHPSGSRFVLMDSSDLTFVPAELFELGRTLTFRVTSFGASASSDTVTVVFTGASQKERQPAYLKARRDGSDLIVEWQGVGRLGGGSSVGMGAYFDGYIVSLGDYTLGTNAPIAVIPYEAGTLSVRQSNSITGLGPAITVIV
jgi:hypothetical protein